VPVRDALQRLEAEGLGENRPRVGPDEADKAMRRHTGYRREEVMQRLDSVVSNHESHPDVFIRQRSKKKAAETAAALKA
jgi:Mn-dependent DtxR family transcriptional regulator